MGNKNPLFLVLLSHEIPSSNRHGWLFTSHSFFAASYFFSDFDLWEIPLDVD